MFLEVLCDVCSIHLTCDSACMLCKLNGNSSPSLSNSNLQLEIFARNSEQEVVCLSKLLFSVDSHVWGFDHRWRLSLLLEHAVALALEASRTERRARVRGEASAPRRPPAPATSPGGHSPSSVRLRVTALPAPSPIGEPDFVTLESCELANNISNSAPLVSLTLNLFF